MPIPKPHKGEDKNKFISRCMGDENMKEYPQDQRAAICYSQWRDNKKSSNTTNLAMVAEKLVMGKWFINAGTYTALCKKLDGYLRNPVPLSDDLVPPTDYVAGVDENPNSYHAIIHVQGILSKNVSEEAEQLLGLVDVDWISNLLDQAASDPSVKDIIIQYNSPGGEVTGIEELGRKILAIDKIKPVYSWCENQSDSAAYFLFSQGRICGMTPSSQIGGIGVYVLVNQEIDKLKKEGCEIIPISSGKFKLMGHEFHELSKEERTIIQEDVNKQHLKFKTTVLSRRPNISEDDMEGLSYNGQDALDKHFVDVLSDNIEEFISTIDKQGDIYNNMTSMKPQITTVKVEAKAETSKKLSFIDKLKQLMGQYDGAYQEGDLPGLPGVKDETDNAPGDGNDEVDNGDEDKEENSPTNYTEQLESLSKRFEELEKKFEAYYKKEEEEEEEEEKEEGNPPKKMEEEEEKKMEGDYDGTYAKSSKTDEKVEEVPLLVKQEIAVEKLPNTMPTQEEFMKMCGMGIATKPKAMSDWEKICAETFTGKIFNTKE